MAAMRESAPGRDEVTIMMMHMSGELGMRVITNLVQQLWRDPDGNWDTSLCQAAGVCLWKRQVTSTNTDLLSCFPMSRLMARILAMRLRQHVEDTNSLPAYQWGFRPNRSNLDVILILRILIDLAVEILPREQPPAEDLDPLQFILLDIQKAYPSLNREAAWSVFTRHVGVPSHTLRLLQMLQTKTVYTIRARAGLSQEFSANKGLREGCPSSPVCFNMFHTMPMTRFAQTAAARWETPGVQMFSRRGRPLSKRARHQQELREHGELLDTLNLSVALFADDTTLITRRSRASDIENLAVQTLADWRQTVHPRKTERVVIQTAPPPQGCEHHVRFLGAWLEPDGRTGADTDHPNVPN